MLSLCFFFAGGGLGAVEGGGWSGGWRLGRRRHEDERIGGQLKLSQSRFTTFTTTLTCVDIAPTTTTHHHHRPTPTSTPRHRPPPRITKRRRKEESKRTINRDGRLLTRITTVEDNMNVQLKDVTCTARDGRVSHLEQVYIRGSHVRFFIVPDMLRYYLPCYSFHFSLFSLLWCRWTLV